MMLSRVWRITIIVVPSFLLILTIWLTKTYNTSSGYLALRVLCDGNLPLPELTACVDKNYTQSQSAAMIKERILSKGIASWSIFDESFDLKHNYKEISTFKPLKTGNNLSIYGADNQAYFMNMDVEGNPDLHIPVTEHSFIVLRKYTQPVDGNKCKVAFENVIEKLSIVNWKYLGNRTFLSKDMLVTKEKGQEKVYTASYEAVRLLGNNALYVVSINNLCRKKDKFQYCGTDYIRFVDDYSSFKEYEENVDIAKEYKEDKNFYKGCSPYPQKFAYFISQNYPEKKIELSADKRDNPNELYVKVNNRVFALNLSSSSKRK